VAAALFTPRQPLPTENVEMGLTRQLLVVAALVLQPLHLAADDIITSAMSPIASFQYPADVGTDILASGGLSSPFVSYRYLEDFAAAALANGGMMSPFASYQYCEWPGDGILQLSSSPLASYYYQLPNGSGPLILHGRVADARGVPLAGAKVSVTVFLSLITQATTDADGNYQLPTVAPGVHNLWTSALGHRTSLRAVTLNTGTSQQDFQLDVLPSGPVTVQVNRQPTVHYTVDAKKSGLLLFNGTSFMSIDSINAPSPSLPTVVLTHGWVRGIPTASIMATPFDGWPTAIASQLMNAGITSATANIVAWDWRYAAMDPPPAPSNAVDLTPDQGVALGEALMSVLGPSYSQPLHFFGHSLGTIVNAAAVNFLERPQPADLGIVVCFPASPPIWRLFVLRRN